MIEVRNIHKSFKNKTVLKNASLEVNDGEVLAIIGRSGSGKSVMLKHMIGLLKPDSGQILVDGIDINAITYRELQKIRQHFGVLFQGGALFDSMNSFDNVAFPLRTFTKMTEGEVRATVEECLEVVELPEVGTKLPS